MKNTASAAIRSQNMKFTCIVVFIFARVKGALLIASSTKHFNAKP
jgi:hypothetical protein